MNDLSNMLWIEFRKAFRSRMPLWTALGSLFVPAGIAFLIFVSCNPQISQQLGLVSAKANLVAYSATDWPAYLRLYGEIIGAGGLILFILVISWVFGREFVDGTLKDMLAVPVPRLSILLAKFIVVAFWAALIIVLVTVFGLLVGVLLGLPGGSSQVILQGVRVTVVTACLAIAGVMPFALLASVGRGYLLPMGAAVLILVSANLVVVLGWGEYYPWAVPILYAQGLSALPPASYWIVLVTSLAGMAATYLWWQRADLP
jgi:ABC-2 type transport system permease protein